MKKSIRLYISGLVQGISFRAFVKENAERYNVKGFCRNLEDGRVEVFLEGNNTEVDKMIEICNQGPKHSKITGVEEKEERFQDMKNFKVLHI
ncbi:acylphosphatase [Candidatus Pacearchaeota archaeon CG10_big_fil_rev_8_21_14_0_10_32_14]|nr:MAG: acylphosphatase [Candidatus Pacearchaeota archaeon CG10_big_fil_rev_8_21_14_0_10_32_14]